MKATGILIAVLALGGAYACSGTRGTGADGGGGDGSGAWITLLGPDRASLANWEMFSQDQLEGWTYEGGELRASGAGWDARKDLVTKRDFDDFELSLDWKIDSANSSGIFYHVAKDGKHEIYELAPEYQVMDDANWPTALEPNQRTAGNYAMHEAKGAVPKRFGEWNSTRILVRHPHVEHWLNGRKVVEFEIGDADWQARKANGKWASVDAYASAKTGRIGLQNAGKVTYRNIKIREL